MPVLPECLAQINADAVCAMITAMGYVAANQKEQYLGHAPKYTEEDFKQLTIDHGLYCNAVISRIRESTY